MITNTTDTTPEGFLASIFEDFLAENHEDVSFNLNLMDEAELLDLAAKLRLLMKFTYRVYYTKMGNPKTND